MATLDDCETDITEKSCCSQVMDCVARKEEQRLIRTLFLVGPLLIICSWLVILALHMSITHYLETRALTTLSEVETETQSVTENVSVIFQLFLSQLKSDAFVLFGSSIAIIAGIIAKSKLYTFPYRIKEIKKFKLNKKSEAANA